MINPWHGKIFRRPGNKFNRPRRRTILGLGVYLGAVLANAGVRAAAVCLLTPDSGEGPFYFDPELVRSDIRSGEPGVILDLTMQIVSTADCRPLEHARVDVWHANALGLYSGYTYQRGVGAVDPRTVRKKKYLRGIQFTDVQGRARFRTVYPSWYYGRTPHVHFKIYIDSREALASQIFFPDEINDDVLNNCDPYREYAARRNVTNANDMFLRNGVEGVFCEVEKNSVGYDASVVVVIAVNAPS